MIWAQQLDSAGITHLQVSPDSPPVDLRDQPHRFILWNAERPVGYIDRPCPDHVFLKLWNDAWEATIDETLNSARLQTHSNLEIIVVDEESTDRTNSIVMAHAYADDRVRVISQNNSGVAAARNEGWQAATSSLIAFLDADEVWAESKIQRQLELILKGGDKVGLVYTWYSEIDEQSRILRRPLQQTARGNVVDQLLLGNLIGDGSSAQVRRHVLEDVGGFDSALRDAGAHGCEDYLSYFRVAARSEFDLILEHLTGYRVLGQRMSSDRPRMLKSWLLVAAEMNRCYPGRSTLVDLGMEYYVRSLLIDAFALSDIAQVRPLISVWSAHRSKGASKRRLVVSCPMQGSVEATERT